MAMTPDSIKWLLDHAASTYEAEIKSTDKIRERISFILSLTITPCFGVAAYLASSLRGEIFATVNIFLFWIPLFIAVAVLLVSTCYVAYVLLKGFYYSVVPSPSQIITYFEEHPEPDIALQDAHLELFKEYAKSIDNNYKQNEHRKSKLLLAQRLAFLSFAILILCVPKWAYNFTHNEQKAQPVKVVSPVPVQLLQEQKMSEPTVKSTSPAQQTTDQAKAQVPLAPVAQANTSQAKPSFPTSRMAMDSACPVTTAKPSFPKSTLALESFDPKAAGKKNAAK
jgi:hypothetical protein